MTVANTSAFAGPYLANGSTTVFPFSFDAAATSEVGVLVDGVAATSGFTVTLNAGGNGGSVTFATAPASGVEIMPFSDPDFTQDISIANNGPFLAEVVEEGFDRAARRDIKLRDTLDRAIVVPHGDTAPDGTPTAVSAWLEDALLDVLPSSFKGDPGGNVMAIGPFASAAGLTIPIGTDLVQTSGYASAGTGAALYAYDATVDAAYVAAHPRTSFISANGRGFKLAEPEPFLEMFGAVGDGVTDDYAAITAAIASLFPFGGIIRCRPVAYRSNQRITLTCPVQIHGAGNGIRSGTFGETFTGLGWENYTGTRFVFPASTAGFFLPLNNDVENANDVVANQGATASNPTYWEYANGEWPSLRNMVIYSLGGTDSTKHGVDCRSPAILEDLTIFGFPGDGLHIIANLNSSSEPYGNASLAQVRNVSARYNSYRGFFVSGRDANIITFVGCNAFANGSWGIEDDSLLGNTYVGCHLAGNNTQLRASANASIGAVRCEGTVARSCFFGCYVEGGNGNMSELGSYVQVLGGIMPTAGGVNRNFGMVIDGDTLREAGWRALRTNSSGTLTVGVTFGAQRGDDPELTGVLGYGSQDHISIADGQDSTRLHYQSSTRNWAWYRAGVFASEWMGHYTDHSTERRIAPFYRNGIFLGSPNDTLHNHIYSATTAPEDGAYTVGDIRFRKSPTAGGKIGWVCTTAGTKASTAWSAGVSALTLSVANTPQLATHRTNGGNVYRLTTAPASGTTANAPVHGAGEVIGADGFGWTFVNATSVPVFKEWGVIDA